MRIALLACRPKAAQPGNPEPFAGAVSAVRIDRDAAIVTRLADDTADGAGGRAGDTVTGPQPRGRGLIAELASRPGREVEAWLATIPAPGDGSPRAAGLVSLVESRSATGIRHSIGWLLVHPAARRQGVGRALVSHACRRAAEQAAQRVWVECRSDWPEAMAFWQAVGFDRTASPDRL
jgi:GNAT superfamily N-acetyltransferase